MSKKTTTTKKPAAKRPSLFRGHETQSAWRELFAHMFGGARGHLTSTEPTVQLRLISSAASLLEAERLQETPMPPADCGNIVREERRPAAGDPEARQHPVHDRRWYTPNQRRLWIPWAEDAPSGARRGTYPRKYPTGLVIHWTAGHRNGLAAGNSFMRVSGMLYLLGDAQGRLSQSDPLDRWGYHAGASSWPGASGTVSDEFAGVEMQAWGMVTKQGDGSFRSWSGHIVPAAEVRHVARRENIRAGHYHILTRPQMDTLRRLCVWLHLNNPQAFEIGNIVGHDEVSPGRKVDPGGALWDHDAGRALSMPEFRDLIRADVAAVEKFRVRQTK